MSLKKLESQIRYKYKDINILELALVHKSSNNKNNNERLEFLGDSVLNLIISDHLYRNFPDVNEGLLTRMRSFLVKGDTLAKKASELGLLNFIKLSKGTANLSDQRKHSILEGSIESIIGSVYLDGGWTEANRFVLNLFKKELSNIKPDQEFRDSKTELQELLQSKKMNIPNYVTKESTNGFNCEIVLNSKTFTANGVSKRIAEIATAKKALLHLKSDNG
jgi:ribonuclease-3